MKQLIKTFLGVKNFQTQFEIFNRVKFEWANNIEFNELYNIACEKTQTKSFEPHKMRSYTAIQFLGSTPRGEVAECGTFRGTLAHQMRTLVGHSIHLFDSFEGISARTTEDSIRDGDVGSGGGQISCSLEEVQQNLSGFSDLKYYKGWIPERFHEVKDLEFSFVYVDVDVYQPTRDSFDFFYPRLVRGGVIMCDDYGFNGWPGAKKAVDEIAKKYGFKVIPLTTGQCLVIK